ncbi:MAG: hypothetical protein ACHQ50_04620 [Fimbriimonadales bacterium]
MKKLLAIAVLLAVPGAFAQTPAGTPFTRIYKQGEKVGYTVNHVVKLLGTHTLNVDIGLTVSKVLEKGRAELHVHWSNLHTDPNESASLPADMTIQTGPNNMAEHFAPTQGEIGFYVAFLQLASATADKPVNAGDEVPVSWDGGNGSMAFKGTLKVLEITPEKKRLKALIKAKPSFGGQEAGEITLTSTYDLTDGSLIQSTGAFMLGTNAQDFTFTRKSNP